MRVVLDSNVVVSFAILTHSRLGRIVDQIFLDHTVLYSEATFAELARSLLRPKLRRYIDVEDVDAFLRRYESRAERVAVTSEVAASRDPGDDKFLQLALDGVAACIVTGDPDLLVLHPFRGIDIIRVTDFDARYRRG